LYLLGAVIGWILSMVVSVIFIIGAALIPGLNSPQHAQAMGMAMIFLIYGSSFAMQAFTKPVYAIALMLFYYDQRIRNEGFDIEWMMERAGLVAGVAGGNGEVIAGANGESLAGANGEARTVANGEPGPERTSHTVDVPVEMESIPEGETVGAARMRAATEQAEATEATQPETGVQE
jgi:hypothetical protein